MKDKGKIVNDANQIVTDHLVKRFIQEVDFFYAIVEVGDQLLLFNENRSLLVLDVTNNKDSTSLIEAFCKKYANKSNILTDVRVDEVNTLETLIFTLQDGKVFYLQDFSKLYLKL